MEIRAYGTLCLSDVGNLRPKEIGTVDISKCVSLSERTHLLNIVIPQYLFYESSHGFKIFSVLEVAPADTRENSNTGEKGWETKENHAAPCYHGCFLGYKENQPP